jgi:hypothetical protein
MSDLELLEAVEFDECPSQTNGHDWGLFAVAVVLHLVKCQEVTSQTFRQSDITATYLEGITMSEILWQSTQWLNANPCPPPRYGIVTSNTSELCVNNMFAETRNLGWPEAFKCKDWDVVPLVA